MTPAASPVSTPPNVGTDPTGPSILLVDDEFDLRFVTRLLLEGSGYLVTEAINGRDALEQIRIDPPDIVITDIDMPGMNGHELIDRIRADPTLNGIPIVAWSERLPERCRADAVLPKGPGIRELEMHLARILEGVRDGQTEHR